MHLWCICLLGHFTQVLHSFQCSTCALCILSFLIFPVWDAYWFNVSLGVPLFCAFKALKCTWINFQTVSILGVRRGELNLTQNIQCFCIFITPEEVLEPIILTFQRFYSSFIGSVDYYTIGQTMDKCSHKYQFRDFVFNHMLLSLL